MKLLTPQQLAEIREWLSSPHVGVPSTKELALALLDHITALETTKQGLERRETEFLLPSINDLQTTITALEAEKVALRERDNLSHTHTCQTIVLGSQHCDCHRRALCDCPDCIKIRSTKGKMK